MLKNILQTQNQLVSIIESLILSSIVLLYYWHTGEINFNIAAVELCLWALLSCFIFFESLKWFTWQYKLYHNSGQLWAKSTLLRLNQEEQKSSNLPTLLTYFIKPQKLYLVLGNRQSGKSTLLTNTGAKPCDSGFQYQEKGMIFHQWWRHNHHFCLETSCLMGPEKNHHEHFKNYMNTLIKNLSWYHQANGFSGIILSISCQNLLQEQDRHHSQRLQHLQGQIRDLAHIAPHIPIFIVVTFFDIIPHFKTFFHDFEHSDFDKPLGYTVKKNQQQQTSLKKQIDKITQALETHLIHTLEKYPSLHHQEMHKKIHAFQHEIYTLQPRLYQCIQEITKTCSNPICGVLYTCQHTDKKEVLANSDLKNTELTRYSAQHLPRAFFSKNILSAIDSCTQRLPSRKNQLILAICALIYVSTTSHTLPILQWFSSWQTSTFEQVTHAPLTSQFYDNQKSYDLPLLPVQTLQQKENTISPPQINELSILNNQSSSYHNYLQQSAWPKIQEKLQKASMIQNDNGDTTYLNTLIFSHMLSQKVPQNLHYMQNWLKKQVEENKEIWDEETQQHIMDIIEKEISLSPPKDQALPPIQKIKQDDSTQIQDLISVIQPFLSQTDNNETAIAIACTIKASEPVLFGPWQQYQSREDCQKTHLATTTQKVISAQIHKISALTQYPTADPDIHKYRRKLQYLERNIDEIVDSLKTETQNIANGPHSKLTEPNSELDNLISAVEQIDIVACKNILHKMQRVLHNITNNEQPETNTLHWLTSILIDNSVDRELIPNANNDILTRYQLEIFWQAIIKNSTAQLDKIWQDTIVKNHQGLSKWYPFSVQNPRQETPPEIFNQLFAYGDTLDQFIEKYLMPFIQDSPENGLEWKTLFGYKIPFSHDSLHMIMTQKIIQSMYYPNHNTTPEFQASLQMQHATDSIKKIMLIENHQKQTISRERPIPITLKWPNSGQDFILQAELSNQDIITLDSENGFWNLIKVMKKHASKRLNAHQVQLVFSFGEHKVIMIADNLKKISPLTEDLTENFSIPTSLYHKG